MSRGFTTFVLLNFITDSMSKLRIIIASLAAIMVTTAMAKMPRDYYPDNLEGRNKGDLKTELHKLIKQHVRIEYGRNGTWVVFRESDIREDGTIWDMYSKIDRYFPSYGSHYEMNIEHSVPKSWWGDSDQPYKMDGSYDLHHLVPSDADANMAKSNFPLGEVVGTVQFNNGLTKVGAGASFNVFEPADIYKGDFARMYLYFVTCYQDYTWRSLGTQMFVSQPYPTLNKYGQELLLKWHRQDPVSQKEIDRNNAVYKHQHNRNPFIDYPNMVEYIWGDSTEYAFRFEGAGIVAPSINVKSGDAVIFNNIATNSSDVKSLTIKGSNLTSSLYVKLNDDTHFTVSPTSLAPDEVMSKSGAVIDIVYHPMSSEVHETQLVISGDDLPDDIVLSVSGLSMPASLNIVTVDNLKASYSRSDADVQLHLCNNSESVTWYIDNKPLASAVLSPASLDEGLHTIKFVTPRVSGKVRIMITQ